MTLQPTELPSLTRMLRQLHGQAAVAQQPCAESNKKPEKPRVKHGWLQDGPSRRHPLAAPQDGPAGEEEADGAWVRGPRVLEIRAGWPALSCWHQPPSCFLSPTNQNRDLTADLPLLCVTLFPAPMLPPGLGHQGVSQEAERQASWRWAHSKPQTLPSGPRPPRHPSERQRLTAGHRQTATPSLLPP